MQRVLISPLIVIVLGGLILISGCVRQVEKPVLEPPPPHTPEPLPDTQLDWIDYSIQVGAFAKVLNAIRLTASLNDKGLDAFYFRHKSGLYKVRFGDYRSRDSAERKAEDLQAKGLIGEYFIVYPRESKEAAARPGGRDYLRGRIVLTAKGFIGLPYVWGGASPSEGFDCSGLTMAVYRLNGLNLPRTSHDQFRAGTSVSRSQIKKGDLVFFNINRGKKVSHVGIYIGGRRFIHAPGQKKTIRTSSLDEAYFKDRFAGARTYF